MNRIARPILIFMVGLLAIGRAQAEEIASADLQIQGVGLKVVTVSASYRNARPDS